MQCYQCARLQYEAELKQANEGKNDLANVPKHNVTSNKQKHKKGENIEAVQILPRSIRVAR